MDEKILKKTVELVLKDMKNKFGLISKKIYHKIKIILQGIISGAAICLLNSIGVMIYDHYEKNVSVGDSDDALFMAPLIIAGILTVVGIIYKTATVGWPFAHFLIFTHMIGIGYMIFIYLGKKRDEAMNVFDEKKDQKIKKTKGGKNK